MKDKTTGLVFCETHGSSPAAEKPLHCEEEGGKSYYIKCNECALKILQDEMSRREIREMEKRAKLFKSKKFRDLISSVYLFKNY